MDNRFHSALYAIFRSLARIIYRKGIPFGEVASIFKRALVDVTGEELANDGFKPTISRIAVTLGLTRKDVAALVKQQAIHSGSTRQYNRMTRILSAWSTDPEFLDMSGKPATLIRQGDKGSFDALIQKHSGDMLPRAALDALIRINAAKELDSGLIVPNTNAYLTHDSEDESLAILGTDVALLISTIDHNLTADAGDLWYQRKVRYDNLPAEALPEFKKFASQENQKLLVTLNQWLAEHDRDANPQVKGSGRMSAGVGVYYFENPNEDEQDEPRAS